MINVPVYDNQGKALEAVAVDEAALGGRIHAALLRQAVQMYENNRHVCTKGHLTRGMVSGSTKKMYRQKHTGNARAGQRTVPQRRGGGLAFPPETRDISWHMPQKARRVATRSALLARMKDGVVSVVDSIPLTEPKTREIVALLKSLNIAGTCALVHDSEQPMIYKSARNIAGVTVRRVADLNAYDLLNADHVLFTKTAFDKAMEALRI